MMTFDHCSEHIPQTAGGQRLALRQPIQQTVEARHVNALGVRHRKVDLRIHAGMQFTAVIALLDEHGQIDPLHAHPLKGAQGTGALGQGNVGEYCGHSSDIQSGSPQCRLPHAGGRQALSSAEVWGVSGEVKNRARTARRQRRIIPPVARSDGR